MLVRLILAIDHKPLQQFLEQRFALADVWVESCGQARSPWQKVIRSCGDIIVISESLIPGSTDTGIAMLNDLPENPTHGHLA